MPPIRSNQLSCRSLELTTHKTHIQKRRLPCSRVLYGDVGFGSINMNMGARLSPRAILRTHSIQTTSSFFSIIILFFIFREKREYESQRRNPRKSGRTWRHAFRDKPEDTEKAIRELGISYPQIINAQDVPATLYGIDALPHTILFAPDGTIIAHNSYGEELKEKLAEIFK